MVGWMMRESEPARAPRELGPDATALLDDALTGLRSDPPTLPCKLLYDGVGARLFERICELEEYYPTRTEVGILRDHVAEMARAIGERALIVEFGSGEGIKPRLLLAALRSPTAYVPIDISAAQLRRTADALDEEFPGLRVEPVCADYTSRVSLPEAVDDATNVVVFFPGSTIGNFTTDEAVAFLSRVARLVGAGGRLLIGVDLRKDPARLVAAYDDAEGVTAAFNLNVLTRLKNELGVEVDVGAWTHEARWNEVEGRIEMHLVAARRQTIRVGGEAFPFEAGDSIHTENSYKYTLDGFAEVGRRAGFTVERVWTDPEDLFSVQLLRADASVRGAG